MTNTTTTQSHFSLELPAPISDSDCVSLFESLDLQQQAQRIENAVGGFCRNTLDRLRRLGDILNKFELECIEQLGDKKGKAAFESWLGEGSFGGTKYIAKAAMAISSCFLELDDATKELARKNVNTWSVGALKALAKAAKVSVLLLKALVKRGGNVSEKNITNLTELLKEQQPKQPKLPLGEVVEIIVDDERQIKGKIATVVDKKDEHGNIIVRLLDSGMDATLKSQDLTKKTPKAANESLLEVIEHLHEESLEKELKLREYQSAITPAPITEVMLQSEREQIASDAIAAYKQSQENSNMALQVNPNDAKVDNSVELANTKAKVESANQTIQKLLEQLESKEKLTQKVEDLERQLVLKQQLESENQQLRQQILELQSTQLHPASNLDSNQDLGTDVSALNGLNNPQFKEASTSVQTNGKEDLELSHTDSLPTLSSSLATLTTSEIEQTTKHFLSHSSDLEMVEINKYQVKEMSKPANSLELSSQLEILELKKELEISQRQIEISQRQNVELIETNEVLVEMMNILKLDHAGEKLKKHQEKLEKNLGKNTSRASQVTTSKPLGFAVRKTSASR